MNRYLVAGAVLAFIVGVVHSVLGEILIFRRMRVHGLVPTDGGSILLERHVRILWASWHLATAFGWGIAVILLRLASPDAPSDLRSQLSMPISGAMLASSLLVLIGTKGRHPGWVGLLGAAILAYVGGAR